MPDIRLSDAEPRKGLGAVRKLWAFPHFDRLQDPAPRMAEVVAAQLPAGTNLIGIEELTAIVADGDLRWVVHGRQSVWVSGPDDWKPFQCRREGYV